MSKTTRHNKKKGLSASKIAPKWEGPYVIREAYDSRYFLLKISRHPLMLNGCNLLSLMYLEKLHVNKSLLNESALLYI